MNRRTAVVGSLCLGIVISAAILAKLAHAYGDAEVSVSFVNSEASNGEFPDYTRSERLAFDVQNAGSRPSSVDISEIEIEPGHWVPTRSRFEEVMAGQGIRYYIYLPLVSHPRRVRMRVHKSASVVQKALVAVRLLVHKSTGRFPVKQVWPSRMTTLDYELIVNLKEGAEHQKECS